MPTGARTGFHSRRIFTIPTGARTGPPVRRILTIPAVLALILAAGASAATSRAATMPGAMAGIPWIENTLDPALRQAKVKKEPLLVYFHTSWCSWCIELDNKVFSDEDVIERSGDFVTIRIDGDLPQSAADLGRYTVSSYPTILVLSSDGNVLGRLAAFRPATAFLEFLDASLSPGETLAAIDARIDAGDHSPALLLKSAEKRFDAFQLDAATKRFEEAATADRDGKAGVADDALIGLAHVKTSAGETAGALDRYRRLLRQYPTSDRLSEAFAGALAILEHEAHPAEIEALFTEFASRFPDDPAVLNDQASRALAAKKDTAPALKQARRAVELSPSSAEYRSTLARVLLASGEPERALEEIGRAIDLRPSDQPLRVLRLEILEAVRKHSAPKR